MKNDGQVLIAVGRLLTIRLAIVNLSRRLYDEACSNAPRPHRHRELEDELMQLLHSFHMLGYIDAVALAHSVLDSVSVQDA